VSSALFFSLGVQAWFSDRVRTALQESQAVAEAYLKEHQQNIRGDILAMARDLSRAAPDIAIDPKLLHRVVATQGALRSLSEAMVFDSSGRILSRWSNLGFSLFDEDVPVWALDRARQGEPVIMESETDDRVRALIKLERLVDVFLYVSRFVDSRVLGHIERTREAVSTYEELEGERSSIEITFQFRVDAHGLFEDHHSRPMVANNTLTQVIRHKPGSFVPFLGDESGDATCFLHLRRRRRRGQAIGFFGNQDIEHFRHGSVDLFPARRSVNSVAP